MGNADGSDVGVILGIRDGMEVGKEEGAYVGKLLGNGNGLGVGGAPSRQSPGAMARLSKTTTASSASRHKLLARKNVSVVRAFRSSVTAMTVLLARPGTVNKR